MPDHQHDAPHSSKKYPPICVPLSKPATSIPHACVYITEASRQAQNLLQDCSPLYAPFLIMRHVYRCCLTHAHICLPFLMHLLCVCLDVQQPVSTESSKRLMLYLPAAAEAGQGLGAVSVFVGSPHARTPACNAEEIGRPRHQLTRKCSNSMTPAARCRSCLQKYIIASILGMKTCDTVLLTCAANGVEL